MNLCELYSLTSAAKLSKPKLIDKYYPLNCDKYITFSPFSKPAKNYSYWSDVLDILQHILQKNNIQIVQLGASGEIPFNHCLHTQGTTSISQTFYLLKNSLLHLSADTYTVHAAGIYDIPIVALFSNNYAKNTKSYWATNQICIEPPRKPGESPSFALDEGPKKQIDRIKPEQIAQSVCQLLNLEYNYPYKTLLYGESYQSNIIESIPTHAIDISNLGISSIIVRMDYLFNETILAQQLQICPCSIVTNKPINDEIIQKLKPNIKEVIYIIDRNNNPDFIKKIQRAGIPFHLISYLSAPEINELKLNYCDYGVIIPKTIKFPAEIDELKNKSTLFFKSHKKTLASGKIYPSIWHYLNNKDVPNLSNEVIVIPSLDNKFFWKDLEFFSVLEKV